MYCDIVRTCTRVIWTGVIEFVDSWSNVDSSYDKTVFHSKSRNKFWIENMQDVVLSFLILFKFRWVNLTIHAYLIKNIFCKKKETKEEVIYVLLHH